MAEGEVYREARVINPPARVLVRNDDGVWSADLLYWLRDHDGRWWGHVESISGERRRRSVVAATHLAPVQRQQVQVYLDDKWRPARLLGWRTTIDDHGHHFWQGLVEVRTEKWNRVDREELWFKLDKLRGAAPPPSLPSG